MLTTHALETTDCSAALELLAEADAYLREIRAENLDGSEPALGELLDRILALRVDSEV